VPAGVTHRPRWSVRTQPVAVAGAGPRRSRGHRATTARGPSWVLAVLDHAPHTKRQTPHLLPSLSQQISSPGPWTYCRL
jgi:hypothetical protein